MAQFFDLIIATLALIVVIIYAYITYQQDKDPWWDDSYCFSLMLACGITQCIMILIRVSIIPTLAQI